MKMTINDRRKRLQTLERNAGITELHVQRAELGREDSLRTRRDALKKYAQSSKRSKDMIPGRRYSGAELLAGEAGTETRDWYRNAIESGELGCSEKTANAYRKIFNRELRIRRVEWR